MRPASNRPTILICDDDASFRAAVWSLLNSSHEILQAEGSETLFSLLKAEKVDLLLLDVQLEKGVNGIDLIHQAREIDESVPVIIVSGLTDLPMVRRAMNMGAVDYVPKSAQPEEILLSVERALSTSKLHRERNQLIRESKASSECELVGQSEWHQSLCRILPKLRKSQENVLITGETGTGKELIARALRAVRPDGVPVPFIAIDSATITGSLAESILFGHEKGAFTGADKRKVGLFEEASGGIVFFDEISNMSLEIQAKLLRVLQEREVFRLGSARPIPVQFRVIASTNQRLEELSSKGLFKEDLYQRLNVLPVEVPPLRDRREDIPPLLDHFLSRQPNGKRMRFSTEAIDTLTSYPWPGNIRELRNLVAYIVTMGGGSEDGIIDLSDLPARFRANVKCSGSPGGGSAVGSFYDRVGEFERSLLHSEYLRVNGNVSRLAIELQMDRSHLYSKLREYGVHHSRAKSVTPFPTSPSESRLRIGG